jgi:predicted glutamine amidotransferase
MCGIVGVVTKAANGFTKKEEDIFWDLLYADTLRGDDATGVVFVQRGGDFGIMKEASPAHWAATTMRDSTMSKQMFHRGKALIGHNRKATVGKVVDDTSHPFVVDNTFAMVHNGTLYGHKLLADTTVDSEALAITMKAVMGKDYTLEAFEEAMGRVNGAYAVAGFNQETNKVFLTRNKERPLAIIETNEAWFWASEWGMLSWILSRNGVDVSKAKSSFVDEHTLYEINLSNNVMLKEEYKPKKAMTPVVLPGAATGVSTAIVIKEARVSKSQYKRLRKTHHMPVISFYADDWVEKNFPRTVEMDGETEVKLFGDTDDARFPFKHQVVADVDLTQLGTLDDALFEQLLSGRVYDMEFNPIAGSVTLYVDRVTLVPKSNREVRRAQLEEAFAAMEEELEPLNDKVFGEKELEEALEKEAMKEIAQSRKLEDRNEITSALH